MASTTVNFNLKTAGYVNYANQTLTFRLLTAGAEAATGDQSYVTLPGVVTATSAANGDGSVTLFRNGKSGINSIYEVILPNREKAKFLIPSGSATIELATLLVDHVPSGSDTQQSSVYAAAVAYSIQRANHTGTQPLSTISDAATVQLKPSEGAFVNGDKTKLDAIEPSADVTDTANVRGADALMDDELTDLAGVKGVNISTLQVKPSEGPFVNGDKTKLDNMAGTSVEAVQDIAGGLITAASGTKTGIAITYDDVNNDMDFVVTFPSQTDQNFTTADHDKLDGISPSADVTDTTTVRGADALMDDELASIANVKALNQSVVSGAAPSFATTNLTAVGDKKFITAAQNTKLNSIDEDVTTLNLPASTTISTFAKTFLDDADAAAVKSTLAIADTGAIAGFVPKSITFPSTSDFLSLANATDLNVGTSDFTLSFWARLDGSGTEPILNKYSGAGYSLKFSSGSLILLIQGTGDPLSVTLATGLNDNKWHVYVVSVDRDGNAVAFVDNNIQTPVPVSDIQSSLDNTTAFRIGYDGANASSDIAFGNYVVLHKDALSASEAAQIYFSADTALTVGSPLPSLMVDLREATETFTDVSSSPLPVITNGTVRFNQDRLTEFTGTNVLATTTLGYKAGSGGTVTQAATSGKGTAVALDKINGEIVMDDASLANDATAVFTFNNTTIAATDVVIVNIASGVAVAGSYQVTVGAVATNSCSISVLNVSGDARTDTIKLNFAVIKAVKT